MRKVIVIFLMGMLLPGMNIAQQATDILRYSRQELSGTARTLSVSNSNGALGGDYGAIHQNPASLGIYRKSEFMFSPSLYLNNSEASVVQTNGNNPLFQDNTTNLAIDNIGMVFASKLNEGSNNTFNVAIGFNRTAKFNRSFEYNGETFGSIGTRFAELADGKSPGQLDNFREGLAYDAYIIGIEPEGNNYFADFTDEDLVLKQGEFRSSGGVSELDLSFASNIDQKLSIGVKLGVPLISYEEEVLYSETDTNNISPYFKHLEYDQYLNTSGVGFNATLGLIYAPIFPLRFGLAFQSPTWYGLTDDYDSRIYFDYVDDPDIFPEPPPQEYLSPDGRFNYNLNTPWAVRGQVGYIIGKNGFLSAEIEYLDYAKASYGYENNFAQAERMINQEIRNLFDDVINFKVGGEFAYDMFRARVGTAYYQSPFKGDDTFAPSYTAGLGLREDQFFIDLTYRWSEDDYQFSPYERYNPTDARTTVNIDQSLHQILLTVGFKL